MKKIWLGLGAAVIVILLLLQTKFNSYLRVEDSGYAISDSAVKKMLLSDPDEDRDVLEVPYYRFEALDFIYKRGNSFYMGDPKKTQVDLNFPFYINDGAGILFADDSATLFDLDFAQVPVYQGMAVSDRISYNPGRERADATEYLFCGLKSGTFLNLDTLSYEDKGEKRQIAANSVVYFREGYFTYCEFKDGVGRYQICRNIKDSAIVTLNETDFTYHDLLLKLNVISDKKPKKNKADEPALPQFITEVTQTEAYDAEIEEKKDDELPPEDKKDDETQDTNVIKPEATHQTTGAASPKPPKKQSRPSGGGSTAQGAMGVRPDNMRPDKTPPVTPPAVGYIKPVVEITGSQVGVYRLMLDVKVKDEARRLHPLRKVQFEFFEVAPNGTETLAFRTFAGSSQKITAGNGAIKPGTSYRVNAYFTYFDEYDHIVVESILDAPFQTDAFDTLTSIPLKDRTILINYDNRLELPDLQFVKEDADPEAVYGIDRFAGLLLTIKGKGTQAAFTSTTILDGMTIRNFKSALPVTAKSMPNLKANSQYSYELSAVDYFGNKLSLPNNTGDFETCKSRPVASLKVIENKIGDLQMKVNLSDPDASAIPAASGRFETYLVFSSKKNTPQDPLTREECEAYLSNGSQVEGSKVAFVHKFDQDNIRIDDAIITADMLELNKKYYGYLFCDYDLNNGAGEKFFDEVASLLFTSASLSSLGDIYVKADVSNLAAHSAVIMFSLNRDRTNDVLEKLLSDVKFEIIRANGAESIADSFIDFDTDAMKTFSGFDHSQDPPLAVPAGSVVMDASFFSGENDGQNPLLSMTDYSIAPTILATYNGIQYPMNVVLTTSAFKTMREPATVLVSNLLLAAGNLRFDVQVKDPDGAITGNSGHMVVMNLYQQDGTFVKAVRIPKNSEEPYAIHLKNLNTQAKFKLTFIAVEYNEGYSNATFESNKILKEMLLSDSVDLSGSIKLETIRALPGEPKKFQANTKVTIQDKDKIMLSIPYLIQVKKNGVDITESGGYPPSYAIVEDDYEEHDGKKEVKHDRAFSVDKGDNTYLLTLYVILNGQVLELDTLSFTTEETAESISSAEEFIWKIKDSAGKGKFFITDDIDLESDLNYKNPKNQSQTATPRRIVSIFNGKLDFQGYTLSYNYKSNGSGIFSNLGSKSEIANMVFDVKAENYSSAVWDDGAFARFNYGWIHDVSIHYKGGAAITNQHWAALCRINAVTGVIENFTVSNEPEEGLMPFTSWANAGLLTAVNAGIIRNGYAYGDDIYTDVQRPSVGGNINVGAIAGQLSNQGKITNVYSLVNVLVANPAAASSGNAPVWQYGSIAGNEWGKLSNAYGIGQSFYTQPFNGVTFNKDRGPVSGTNNSRNSRVYYWNEGNVTYEKSPYQQKIGLESLHDYSWQASLLGRQFITSNVEVGYYPHVLLSPEMPEQPYLALPDRINEKLVDVMSATVIEYRDNDQAALVEFRLSNTKNAEIREIAIENLTTEIDQDSLVSADGYTTLRAKVSNPAKYRSEYAITSIKCFANNRLQTVTFDPDPLLLVDFYRNIYTAEDWFDYVVSAPTENARLQADIDFTGVDETKIYVAKDYTGKLDGNRNRGGTAETPEGYTVKNMTLQAKRALFERVAVKGEVKNLCVENIIMGKADKPTSRVGMVRNLQGALDNVHMKNVSVTGYEYVGGMAAVMYEVSEIKDSTISGITIRYQEPKNSNTNGRIGGLVGYGYQARITHCYVRDLDMKAEDIMNCEGAGGIIGFDNFCSLDGVYATGDISVRGMNVGGIIGWYNSGEVENCVKNVLSRVNVFSYQDKVGGIIGESGVGYTLNARNNLSGVALGNVFANNPDAEHVSYTVGNFAGITLSFYGSEVQLLNGMSHQPKDENTLGLLTYEELTNPDSYTGEVGMDESFDYSKVTAELLPTLYYEGTATPLPFQTDTPLSLTMVQNNEIQVKAVGCNEVQKYIYMDLINPQGYAITGMTIENLKYEYEYDPANPETTRVWVTYKQVSEQEHWQDSYLLKELTYQKTNEDGTVTIGKADYTANPVRIPLTLFCDIRNSDDWNRYIKEENNFGDYGNFRLVNDISFAGVVPTTNAKIGRLKGEVESGRAKISNINIGPGLGELKGNGENFIFRLNSELSNIAFKDCTVNSIGRNAIGLIGSSSAVIKDMDFENITIDNRSSGLASVGIIGYQVGGKLTGITIKNVEVGLNGTPQNDVGGLVGTSTGGTLYQKIVGKEISVQGRDYIGGLVGRTYKASFDTITYQDIHATGGTYIGGMIGLDESSRSAGNVSYAWNLTLTGTPSYDTDGTVTDSTTVISSRSGSWAGGLAGRLTGYQNGWSGSAANKKPLLVDGIVVKGYGNYIGGAFGQSYGNCNTTVANSLITDAGATTSQFWYAGGISGFQHYENSYNNVKNTTIDVKNHSRVGMLTGYQEGNGSPQYNFVEDCVLKAERTISGGEHAEIGGLIGRSQSNFSYCGVINTSVLTKETAGGYVNVGGVVGFADSGFHRCFYYAEPESSSSAAANPKYQVVGTNNTGGLAGNLNAGGVGTSYSNANVVSLGKTAGGLIGLYNNAYTTQIISDKVTYGYSTVQLLGNYFTGTVHAKYWAGGAIGRNEMNNSTSVAPSHKANGGRSSVADVSGHKSGIANESEYTNRNLILAKSVTSEDAGKAHAFSGIQDGFEGKANGNLVGADNTSFDKARNTYFWDGMMVGKTGEAKRLYDAENADAPDYAKNSGTYRFKLWNKDEYGELPDEDKPHTDYRRSTNVRLVSTEDIKNLKMFRALYWLTWTNSQTDHETEWKEANGSYNGENIKGDYYRFITQGIISNNVWGAVGDAAQYQGKNYLPHIRINEKNNNISDFMVQTQSKYGIALPIPVWAPTIPRAANTSRFAASEKTYAVIYPVDADKINLEFSQDLVDAGAYFKLSCGNQLVEEELITQRVYTYAYDYKEGLKLQYGVANTQQSGEDVDANVEADADVDADADMEVEADTDTDVKVEAESGKDTNAGAESGKDTNAGAESGKDTNAEAESGKDANAEAGTGAEADVVNRMNAEAATVMKVNTNTDLKAEVGADVKADAEADKKAETGSDPETGTGTDAEADTDTAADKTVFYKAAALARHVMTYGTQYYYIDKNGLISGTDSTVDSQNDTDVMPGSFLHIFNGKALTQDGKVLDAESGANLGSVSGMQRLDKPQPLQTFHYDGFQIETYSKFAEFVGNDIVARESQALKGSSGVIGFVDGSIENVKDSILLYTKEGADFQTILGVDGIMVDMRQGDRINAPEGFKNSGIVAMTNNLNCTAPYVLVEYANGGKVGYNYMTGEYLFDHAITNQMNLLDYIKVYFTGDKSMYERMSNSYAVNQKVAEIAGTPDRLLSMVEGNSTGKEIEGNSAKQGTKSDSENPEMAENGAKTDGEKKQAEGDRAKNDETKEEATKSADNNLTIQEEPAAQPNGHMATPPADANPIIGEGKGDGDLAVSGTQTAAGQGLNKKEVEIFHPGADKEPSKEPFTESSIESSAETASKKADSKEADKKASASLLESAEMEAKAKAAMKEAIEEATEETAEEATEAAAEETAKKRSTAGTATEAKEGGINKGKKSPEYSSIEKPEEKAEDKKADETDETAETAESSTDTGKLATVYNQATGTYEIVDMRQYFGSPNYQSENVKLAIQDMSIYAGFAQEKEEKKRADGLILYLIVSVSALAGIGLTIQYRRKHREK